MPEKFTAKTLDALDAEIRSHLGLRRRVLFTNCDPGRPDAASIERNDGPREEIAALVRQGYLVRTRTDEGTEEARANATARRDAALASGAQLLSTDYPPLRALGLDRLPGFLSGQRCGALQSAAATARVSRSGTTAVVESRTGDPEVQVYCPRCGIEFRKGFTKCSDCHIPLLAGKPPELKNRGGPDLELTTVLEGNDRLVIAAAKGLLEDAGIPFYVLGEELGVRYGPVGPFIHPWCRIQVAIDREHQARTLLALIATNPEAPCRAAGRRPFRVVGSATSFEYELCHPRGPLEPGKLECMAQNPAFDRITVEPGKCAGKPCIRGMRITVRRVLEILATYRDREEILREYPFLEEEDLRQALHYAAASVDDEVHYLNQVA